VRPRNLISDDDLHATLQCVSKIGSPIHPASVPETEGSSTPADSSAPQPHAGVSAAFNLDACFTMVEGL
jgi:hypothetical protein